MADAKDRFLEIFGVDVTKKVSDPMRRIQIGVVRAKLTNLAIEANELQLAIEAIATKYVDDAPAVPYAQAQQDMTKAAELDVAFVEAERAFKDATQLANGCQFKMETEMKYYLPTEEVAE